MLFIFKYVSPSIVKLLHLLCLKCTQEEGVNVKSLKLKKCVP